MLCLNLDRDKTRQLLHQGLDRLLAETWITELAHNCSLCERNMDAAAFSWGHLTQHITDMPPDISSYTLGLCMEAFLERCDLLAEDIQAQTLILQHIFVVRLRAHLGKGMLHHL